MSSLLELVKQDEPSYLVCVIDGFKDVGLGVASIAVSRGGNVCRVTVGRLLFSMV